MQFRCLGLITTLVGQNTVTISTTDCQGLNPNGAWGGAYARVTVDYACTGLIPDVTNIDVTANCATTVTAPTAQCLWK